MRMKYSNLWIHFLLLHYNVKHGILGYVILTKGLFYTRDDNLDIASKYKNMEFNILYTIAIYKDKRYVSLI